MDQILKNIESVSKSNETPNQSEEIDLIIYIASLTEDIITSNEFETTSRILYNTLAYSFKNRNNIFIRLLKENDEKQHITLVIDNEAPYVVFVRSRWLFQAILLNSVKFFDMLCLNKRVDDNFADFLHVIVTYIVKYIVIEKPTSVHLLRILLLILRKYKSVLTSSLSFDILKSMDKVALSPVVGFKQYAHGISKITFSTLSKEEISMFFNIDRLPMRGLDTFGVVKLLPKSYIKQNVRKIVKKVLQLFLNNIENKDGGFLYQSVLFYSFDEWTIEVWPLFLNSLKQVEYESEFFQSLLKYWIPSNVSSFKHEFYIFLRNENVDSQIKAYVLLESRKRGLIFPSTFSNDILQIFCCLDTTNLALKIVSTYHKKSLCPNQYEIDVVLSYLHSNLNAALEQEEVKSFGLFFSQMFLHAHINLRKSEKKCMFYASFVENIYRYCYGCLETGYFEVGAQIMLILWTISTGSYESLNLNYKVEKWDFYKAGENLLYKKLQTENLWKFESEELYTQLKKCFLRNKGCGANLTKLLITCFNKIDFINVDSINNVLEAENAATLENTERIKNYSEILFKTEIPNEASGFLEQIIMLLLNNLHETKENYSDENVLYKNVTFLEIILVAAKNKLEVENLCDIIEKALDVVNHILKNNNLVGAHYKTMKVLEAFINNIMYCIAQNKDAMWTNINKDQVIMQLVQIIQRSNMKRPVSLSVEVLKQFGSKMEETDSGKVLKTQFLDAILKSLYTAPTEQKMKIRRSPESRLVIHAMCASERHENKPLLKWVLHSLLDVLADPQSSDPTISSALHSVEILVSDNALQTDTLPFISDIIIHCVELFKRSSWIVRNADLQLAKALIERFYGVSIKVDNRPKNIEDLFLLFPGLSVYFFKILSSERLDDRSVLVFQFFFESQVREHVLTNEVAKINRDCFLALFADVVKKYVNNYGKLAAKSYVSLCTVTDIPKVICDVIEFIKSNYESMPKNVFANFAFLLQELHGKYTRSFEYYFGKRSIKLINSAIQDLLKYLRKFKPDDLLFSFLLFKIEPANSVLEKMQLLTGEDGSSFEKRLWLHNNIPFLLINAKPKHVGNILNKILSKDVLSCVQIKVLSVLVTRVDDGEFNSEEISDITEVLFKKSVSIDDSNNYLLNCYFKTILVFCKTGELLKHSTTPLCYKHTDNLYKIMIFVLYFSRQKFCGDIPKENFYKLVEMKYVNSINTNEELDNDIASTLLYFKTGAPNNFCKSIFKLVFYFAILRSTYLEAYNFISLVTERSYCSIVNALREFLSVKNLKEHFQDEKLIGNFLLDVNKFINSMPDSIEDCDGYYCVENDYLIPKLFLKRLLKCDIDNR